MSLSDHVQYLAHVQVRRTPTCKCPPTAFAPCGGLYEGHYAANCPDHGRGQGHARVAAGTHQGAACRARARQESQR